MTARHDVVSVLAVLILVAARPVASQQRDLPADILNDTQIQYNRGRHVAPIFEGWFRHPDGTIDMWFGYLNLNFEEGLHIPVGPDNRVEPAGPDRGQPAVFVPRRRTGGAFTRRESFVFSVRLPDDWDEGDELVWSVTAHGRTDRAVGLLLPVYELSPAANGNLPPTLQLETTHTRVILPDTLTLSASVSDDGQPANRREQAGVRWVHYRGPGRVTFDPVRSMIPTHTDTVTDVPLETIATFSEPGTFVLRAEANDGTTNRGGTPVIPSTTYAEVTVEVEQGAGGDR